MRSYRYIDNEQKLAEFLLGPPQLGPHFESRKYREWIHATQHCYQPCGKRLLQQNGWLHHHQHTGGKDPRDYMLTRFCAEHHDMLHKMPDDEFYAKVGINNEMIMKDICRMLSEYVGEQHATNIIINAFAIVLRAAQEAARNKVDSKDSRDFEKKQYRKKHGIKTLVKE